MNPQNFSQSYDQVIHILLFGLQFASLVSQYLLFLALDAPANLSARDESESSFSVSWDPAHAEIDGYVLTYGSSEGYSGETPVGPEKTSYTLTSLRPGAFYTVHIWAVKGNKASTKISTQAQTGFYHFPLNSKHF